MNNYNSENLYTVKPTKTESESSSATFCTLLGVLLLIGGVIIAIFSANTGYSFNIMVFLTSLIPYIVAGCMMFCLSELFKNIKSIADSLKGMSVYADPRVVQYFSENKNEVQNATYYRVSDAEIVGRAKGMEDNGRLENKSEEIIQSESAFLAEIANAESMMQIYQAWEAHQLGNSYADLDTMIKEKKEVERSYGRTPKMVKNVIEQLRKELQGVNA